MLTNLCFGVATITCEVDESNPTGNDLVEVECFVESDLSFTLNSYRLALPCSWTPGGGASGTVDHFEIAATPCTFPGTEDPACDFQGNQAACDAAQLCFSDAQCSGVPCLPDPNNPGVKYCEDSGLCFDPSPFVETQPTRTDFIFRGQEEFTITEATGPCGGTPPSITGSLPAGVGITMGPHVNPTDCNGDMDMLDLGEGAGENCPPKYIGSFLFRVSDCAKGSFSVNVTGNSTPPQAGDATKVTTTAGGLQLVSGVGPSVLVPSGQCCDESSCLGLFNTYCCRQVMGGLLSNLTATCVNPCTCTDDGQCDDSDACTDDFCAPAHPSSNEVGCLNVNTTPSGFCCDPTGEGPLDALDDGNVCTEDSCEGGVYPAIHDGPAANGNFCASDGNECTLDTCLNGFCTHDAAGANGFACTDDGFPCTLDTCSGGVCTHDAGAANGMSCPGDGMFCTQDVCNGGVCNHIDINTLPCETINDCPPNAQSCTGSVGNPGLCQCTPGGGPCWGDVAPPAGVVDIDDILCAVAGFANFASCPTADIFPCGGNGVVDIDDILGVLNGFGGGSECGLPSCG
jgi:hypothetical protein